MKIRVVWVGRTKNAALASVCTEMCERLRRLANVEITELREPKVSDDRTRLEVEAHRILGAVDRDDFVVALDAGGRAFSSEGLARFIGRHMAESPKNLVFVVGGPAGLSGGVMDRADLDWSLSELTFSHDLARAVLMEQLYRAMSIVRHHPYAR